MFVTWDAVEAMLRETDLAMSECTKEADYVIAESLAQAGLMREILWCRWLQVGGATSTELEQGAACWSGWSWYSSQLTFPKVMGYSPME